MTPEQITIFASTGALIIGQIIQRLDARRVAAQVKEANAQAAAEAAEQLKRKTDDTANEVKAALEAQNKAAEEAAAKVKADLDRAQADYLLKLEIIRIEGNSKMAAQKKATWNALMRLAKASLDPAHEAEARKAEQEYHDHMEAEELAEQRIRTFVEGQKAVLLEEARQKAKAS